MDTNRIHLLCDSHQLSFHLAGISDVLQVWHSCSFSWIAVPPMLSRLFCLNTSLKNTHVYTSIAIHFEQTFMNKRYLLIFSNKKLLSYYSLFQLHHYRRRCKGKGRLWVLQHCCLEAYCTLTRMSSFIHLQRRCTHQAAWETSASEGRNYTSNLASNP